MGSPKPPEPPPPQPMPDLDDPAALAAKRKVLDSAAARSGRASTVLANGDGSGGGVKLGVG